MIAAIAAALRNIASGIATAARWCWWAVDWTLHAPFRLLGGGGSGGSVPHPTYEPPAENPTAEIRELVASRGRARAVTGALPSDLEPRADGTDPVAATVHSYAKVLPSERDRVSLAALSPDQLGWLLRQSADDLARMAQAGGLVCGRLARGIGGGALGVQPCRRREREFEDVDLTEQEPAEAPRLDYGPGFANGVRRHRPGLRRAA